MRYLKDSFGLSESSEDDVLEIDLEGQDQSWESMTKGSYSGVRSIQAARRRLRSKRTGEESRHLDATSIGMMHDDHHLSFPYGGGNDGSMEWEYLIFWIPLFSQ